MPKLAVYLLGSFGVRHGDRAVTAGFRTEKERALLAYLLVETDRQHPRPFLSELLWPNRPEGSARTNLRQALSGLRGYLGDRENEQPFLLISNDTVRFSPHSDCWLDSQAFLARIQSTWVHDHVSLETCRECAQLLEEAVDLYRGDFLADLQIDDAPDFQEWIVFQREGFFRHLLSALQTLSAYYQNKQDYERAFKFAWRQVNLAPLEESAHRQVMRLQALTGRRSAALEQYALCTRLLKNELKVEPAAETTALYEQIKRGQRLVDEPAPPAEPTNNLPVQLTNFIGREGDLHWFANCLSNPVCRLITVTGAPGVGKSRLGMHAAGLNANLFPDGVRIVPLENVHSGPGILAAIAAVFGFPRENGSISFEALLSRLQNRKTLLILDGFEHLLPETWLLLEILKKTSSVKVLVTSRLRLNYQAACLLELQGLPYPGTPEEEAKSLEFPAVQLFIARAYRSRSSFVPSKESLKDIVRITQLTAGLPLALELAASRLNAFSTAQLAQALENDLGILTSDLLDITPRQRSLRALFDQAWNELSADVRTELGRLSIFTGSFDHRAARAVAQVDEECLAALTAASMLIRLPPQRFTWQPLLRRYVRGNNIPVTAEGSRLEQAYIHYYLELLHTTILKLRDNQTLNEALETLDCEIENIRLALQLALESKVESVANAVLDMQSASQVREMLKGGEPHLLPVLIGASAPDSPSLVERLVLGPVMAGDSSCCGRTWRFDDAESGLFLAHENGQIIDANYQACQLSGYTRQMLITMLVDHLIPGGRQDAAQGEVSSEKVLVGSRGQRLAVEVHHQFLAESGKKYSLLAFRPLAVSSVVLTEETRTILDPLTGLMNRSGFYQRLQADLSRAAQGAQRLAVILMSLDNVSEIQRDFGLASSDQIVSMAGERVSAVIRSEDTVARMSGDEFALLINRLPNLATIERVIDRILKTATAPYLYEGQEVYLTVSIGVCFYPEGADSPSNLLRCADLALNQAHLEGNNHYSIFRE